MKNLKSFITLWLAGLLLQKAGYSNLVSQTLCSSSFSLIINQPINHHHHHHHHHHITYHHHHHHHHHQHQQHQQHHYLKSEKRILICQHFLNFIDFISWYCLLSVRAHVWLTFVSSLLFSSLLFPLLTLSYLTYCTTSANSKLLEYI